jgi:DNA-binding transcriptional LysR family regulator
MLMEMAVLGFGWAAIPRWMVTRFATGKLVELDARGWPRRVPVDAVWSRQRPLGRAGTWLLQEMLAPATGFFKKKMLSPYIGKMTELM